MQFRDINRMLGLYDDNQFYYWSTQRKSQVPDKHYHIMYRVPLAMSGIRNH